MLRVDGKFRLEEIWKIHAGKTWILRTMMDANSEGRAVLCICLHTRDQRAVEQRVWVELIFRWILRDDSPSRLVPRNRATLRETSRWPNEQHLTPTSHQSDEFIIFKRKFHVSRLKRRCNDNEQCENCLRKLFLFLLAIFFNVEAESRALEIKGKKKEDVEIAK